MRDCFRTCLLVLCVCLLGGSSSPISAQGPRSSPTTGYVDPTVASFNSNHPLVACSSSCSTALINQNTDALQAAVNQAATAPHPVIRIPPGRYPVMRGGAAHNQRYGVDVAGRSGIVFDSPGAIIEGWGDCGQGDYYMFQLDSGTAHVKFLPGIVFSQRDLTNCSEHTHDFEIGFATVVDDVEFRGVTFTEQVAGDCINLTGGYEYTTLVQRISVVGTVFDCHRSGIGYQHGTTMVNAVGNFFGSTITDQAIDHEPTSPGGNTLEVTIANSFTRPGDSNIFITQSGSGNAATDENALVYNVINGGTINGVNVTRTWFAGNVILTDSDTQGDSTIELFRRISDVWITDNVIRRGVVFAPVGSVVAIAQNSSIAPTGAWVRGNRIAQYGGGNASITCAAKASMLDTDWIAILDGTTTVNYEFDTAGNGCTVGRTCVNISTAVTATDVCSALGASVASTQPTLVQTGSGAGILNIAVGTGAITATSHVATTAFRAVNTTVGAGVQLDGLSLGYVLDNEISYHGITPDSGTGGGFVGVLWRSQVQAASGIVADNTIRRLLQTSGSQAGRPLAGVDVSADTYNHTGHATVRDNFVDGARDGYLMTQTILDEGPPVIAGNLLLNVQAENLPSSWRAESLGRTETAASGALSPSKRVSFLAPASAGTTHTIPDGVFDGQFRALKWTTGGGDDTVTPTHFGDGTSISVTAGQAAAGAYAVLAWDATSGVWRKLSSNNCTVNP